MIDYHQEVIEHKRNLKLIDRFTELCSKPASQLTTFEEVEIKHCLENICDTSGSQGTFIRLHPDMVMKIKVDTQEKLDAVKARIRKFELTLQLAGVIGEV